jgi:hypothetical protein
MARVHDREVVARERVMAALGVEAARRLAQEMSSHSFAPRVNPRPQANLAECVLGARGGEVRGGGVTEGVRVCVCREVEVRGMERWLEGRRRAATGVSKPAGLREGDSTSLPSESPVRGAGL